MNLPRQDHYEIARDAGVARLREAYDPDRLAVLGAEVVGDRVIELDVLRWRCRVAVEPFSMVVLPEEREPGIVWQVLILDYLAAAEPRAPVRFLSFGDFPEARSYLQVFQGRVADRLGHGVGAEADGFASACESCGGVRGTASPLSYLFHFFPRLEMQLVRYEADEDFPASCSVLLSDNAPDMLSMESVIVSAEKLVSALEGRGPAG